MSKKGKVVTKVGCKIFGAVPNAKSKTKSKHPYTIKDLENLVHGNSYLFNNDKKFVKDGTRYSENTFSVYYDPDHFFLNEVEQVLFLINHFKLDLDKVYYEGDISYCVSFNKKVDKVNSESWLENNLAEVHLEIELEGEIYSTYHDGDYYWYAVTSVNDIVKEEKDRALADNSLKANNGNYLVYENSENKRFQEKIYGGYIKDVGRSGNKQRTIIVESSYLVRGKEHKSYFIYGINDKEELLYCGGSREKFLTKLKTKGEINADGSHFKWEKLSTVKSWAKGKIFKLGGIAFL